VYAGKALYDVAKAAYRVKKWVDSLADAADELEEIPFVP
jgi:hypothetical protein